MYKNKRQLIYACDIIILNIKISQMKELIELAYIDIENYDDDYEFKYCKQSQMNKYEF